MNNSKIYSSYKISLAKFVRLILSFAIILLVLHSTEAQNRNTKVINIEWADIMRTDQSIVKNAQRLIGNVHLTHNNIVIKCDSAWAYTNTNVVDAFGNVHIVNNDTINLWARFINYNGDTEMAKARHNVVLSDPTLTLTTDSLDFDINAEIGYYNHSATIVDSTNTLTSIVGRYYTNQNKLFFTDKVKLRNDDYEMTTDTMIYFTDTEIADFSGETVIMGDETYIYSTSGWFNTKTNETELHKNSTIKRGNTQIQANYLFYNDTNGEGKALGNVVINDFENSMIVTGNKADYRDFDQFSIVTDSAMWIQYHDGDSLFMHADTLQTMPDTSAVDAKMLISYNNVRFFRENMQGICDSLIYFTKDSTIQLFNDPVIWSMENQLTAEFIEYINKSEPPNEVYLNENSFIVQEVDSTKYNQIKGKNMVGYIKGDQLYRIDVSGNGQSIYYPQDDEDFIGLNKAESSNIVIYLSENQINRITFVGSPKGVMNPIMEVVAADTKLDGYIWRANERPVNRFDVFGRDEDGNMIEKLPNSEIFNVLPDIEESKSQLEESWKDTLEIPEKELLNMEEKKNTEDSSNETIVPSEREIPQSIIESPAIPLRE